MTLPLDPTSQLLSQHDVDHLREKSETEIRTMQKGVCACRCLTCEEVQCDPGENPCMTKETIIHFRYLYVLLSSNINLCNRFTLFVQLLG